MNNASNPFDTIGLAMTPSSQGRFEPLRNILDEVQIFLSDDPTKVEPTPIRPEGIRVVTQLQLHDAPLQDPDLSTLMSLLRKTGESQDQVNMNFQHRSYCNAKRPTPAKKRPAADNAVQADNADFQTIASTNVKLSKKRKTHEDACTSSLLQMMTPAAPVSNQDVPLSHQDLSELESDVDDDDDGDDADSSSLCISDSISDKNRFRGYQSKQWSERYSEMIKFREEHGHCLVNRKSHPLLAQWIKRQRYQYKLKLDGRHSTLTEERIAALNQIDFIWDSHKASWEERYQDLRAFKEKHGHCMVPSSLAENQQLAIWVKSQRRQFRLFKEGSSSCKITADRIARLNDLGFKWRLRNRFKLG